LKYLLQKLDVDNLRAGLANLRYGPHGSVLHQRMLIIDHVQNETERLSDQRRNLLSVGALKNDAWWMERKQKAKHDQEKRDHGINSVL
jgi:hypothetical protein